jgi:predicted HTH transcriptional regulator
VFHRDYLEPSSVYVALYDDRLEILSPGELVKDFSLEDAMNGFSKLRNNALGDALEYMKEVEAWGGGVSRYFTACAASGLPSPTVSEEAGFFKVVFWRRAKGGNAQSAPTSVGNPVGNVGNPVGNVGDYDGKAIAEDANLEQVVMNCLRGDVKMSAAKIAKVANVTTRTIERALTRLKASGRIRRKGGTRGVWEVIG